MTLQRWRIPMQPLTDLLAQLVAIDSVNPDLVPGGAGEAALAAFVADWLRAANVEVTLEAAAPGRPNVIGVVRGTGGGRSLLLNAHTDTVGVAGMTAPHTPRVVGGRLYGRGAYDMKASLAAMLLVAAEVARQPLPGDLLVTAVIDEEFASQGTHHLVERWRADAALITEPTELEVCIAHRGFQWLEVTTQGFAAHGSLPTLGVDAIAKMGHLLVELDALDRRLRAEPRHPLLHSGSLHASLISGGQELSSYPERCTLALERRTLPDESPALVEAQLQQILDQLAERDPHFRATLRTTLHQPAFAISPSHELVQLTTSSVQAITGTQPALVGAPFWMDSAILDQVGIPTVIFGPIGGGAHGLEEWVDLASVETCYRVWLRMAQVWCGNGYW
jgi:acetylornithine deacetylase